MSYHINKRRIYFAPPRSRIMRSLPLSKVIEGFTLTSAPLPTFIPATVAPLIPGIIPADVTINLENKGFDCSSVEQGELYYFRTCNKDYDVIATLHAEVYGRGLLSVDFISATAMQFVVPANPDTAASFLGYVATSPFVGDSALQEQARTWVEANTAKIVGDGVAIETTINRIHFVLSGLPSAVTLDIGDLK